MVQTDTRASAGIARRTEQKERLRMAATTAASAPVRLAPTDIALLRAHALLEGRGVVEEDDLIIMRDALWNNPEQRQEIGRLAARLANPLNAKAVELGDQAASVHSTAMA